MPGLICAFDPCRRPISAAQAAKRVEWHKVGGEVRVYGDGTGPDGNLAEATGPLVQVMHGHCFYADLHRRQLDAARDADPSPQVAHADWREQEVVPVEALVEGHGGHRGAGASGL